MSTFLDRVTITVAAGRGGKGAVSFRREKYVPLGGPDGGDGGRGGSVILVASSDDSTLSAFRERRTFKAAPGGDGAKAQRSGAAADDLTLPVPPGTVVRDADTDELLADLDRPGASIVVAAGGRGGRGNARFATSTHQAPRVGELGSTGGARRLDLELKLIADIGLVGLPNAGKSTLLSNLTGAHPKIAAYPFTTLHPNLGVAEVAGGRTVVIADVPGLIEGAHLGVGLGIDFLRHLERTRVLVHLIDASAGVETAQQALVEVETELRAFSEALAAKPRLLAFNKLDIAEAREAFVELQALYDGSYGIVAAATDENCRSLLDDAAALVAGVRAEQVSAALAAAPDPDAPTHKLYKYEPRSRVPPVISREAEAFRVYHRGVEKLVDMTDLNSEEAVTRLQRVMRTTGVDAALAEAGCTEGDTVRVGNAEFLYADDGGL